MRAVGLHCLVMRGDSGSRPHPGKSQSYRVLSTPEKSAAKFAFSVGPSSPASETPFNLGFAGCLVMARFKCYLDPLSPHKKTKQKAVRGGPLLARLS